MSDTPLTDEEIAEKARAQETRVANRLTLEIVFLGLVGLIVIAAFLEALTYKLVSSRTPFVIMVPLIALIAVHGWRLFKVRGRSDFMDRIRLGLSGQLHDLRKIVVLCIWFVILMILIAAFGHYTGILIVSFVLMGVVAGEKRSIAAIVAVVATSALYVTFELGFNVEMWKGYLYRWWIGYRDFG